MQGGRAVFRGPIIIVAGVHAVVRCPAVHTSVIIMLHVILVACRSKVMEMGLVRVARAFTG